jgi:hypothetical protein
MVLFQNCVRHSAVALLLKAALIQVSDYRLLGASGYLSASEILPDKRDGLSIKLVFAASLLFLLNAVCLVEKQFVPIL